LLQDLIVAVQAQMGGGLVHLQEFHGELMDVPDILKWIASSAVIVKDFILKVQAQ